MGHFIPFFNSRERALDICNKYCNESSFFFFYFPFLFPEKDFIRKWICRCYAWRTYRPIETFSKLRLLLISRDKIIIIITCLSNTFFVKMESLFRPNSSNVSLHLKCLDGSQIQMKIFLLERFIYLSFFKKMGKQVKSTTFVYVCNNLFHVSNENIQKVNKYIYYNLRSNMKQ